MNLKKLKDDLFTLTEALDKIDNYKVQKKKINQLIKDSQASGAKSVTALEAAGWTVDQDLKDDLGV